MAVRRPEDIVKRDEVGERARNWKGQGKERRKELVINHLATKYPELEGVQIRRNGHIYNLLEYIAEDLDGYDVVDRPGVPAPGIPTDG